MLCAARETASDWNAGFADLCWSQPSPEANAPPAEPPLEPDCEVDCEDEVDFVHVTQLYDTYEVEASLDEEESEAAEPTEEDSASIRAALEVAQLGHHTALFSNSTWAAFSCADEAQLQEWGLHSLGARLRLLAAQRGDNGQLLLPCSQPPVADAPPAPAAPAHTCKPERPVWSFFSDRPPAAPAPPPKRQRAAARPRKEKAEKKPGAPPGPVPPWQAVPGTQFVVDGFAGAARHATPGIGWLLTHFHSDHYQNLGPRWPSRLPIFCTASTAKLVRLRLRPPPGLLVELPLCERVVLRPPGASPDEPGVGLTLFDANHCPGAAMALFDPPEPHPPVLHTGDCRWDPALMEAQVGPALALLPAERRARLCLVLDTTYADPNAAFPPIAQAVAFITAAVKSESFNSKRTLFLVGSYTIGKERCAFAAARAAGARLFAGTAKRAVLDCLPLAAEDRALLTGDDTATNVHIVPMACTSFARMKGILAHYRGQFDTCVGFSPSGWTFGRGKDKAGGRTKRGSLVRYEVPYSEHSSFEELRAAVRFLRPAVICPSVNNDMGRGCERIVRLLTLPEGSAELAAAGPLRKPNWRR